MFLISSRPLENWADELELPVYEELAFPLLAHGALNVLDHIIRLEFILAGFHRDSGRELCSRMDLEEVRLTR